MIDRYLLRYFLAVVDHGTFSRAAVQAGVSQPTLSVGIAKLEGAMGARLFDRSSKRVSLTEAGTRLLTHARRIESEFNLAEQAGTGDRTAPMLRVGWLDTVPAALLHPVLAQMRRDHPDAPFELVEGGERDMANSLQRGRIDVAVSLAQRNGGRFVEQPLFSEGYALAISSAHPLAGEQQIDVEALADNPVIVRRHCEILSLGSRHFTTHGVRPRFSLRSTQDERVLATVAAGGGLALMPECYRWPGVARPRLAGFDVMRSVALLFADEQRQAALVRHPFIQAAIDTLSA
ncbi:LysR family transcriptional regulator [Sphingobium subterraneum]|uniref:DNA-binding transcriptional LysR family regulator n=1 Tax=Sphingobium subterraneum TaxID=627688 RepID=A0A841J7M0_9SPHN|nr:LysR family transcriptional regulator [Sphingobium subterraneum]MBB6124525.1 DNA-binding transcriptional LysR family regulator [Sphingobium subterraneum]